MHSYLFCLKLFQGTGMSLLLGDSDFGEHIEDRFTFDFQFSG